MTLQENTFDFPSTVSFIRLFEAQAARYNDRTFIRYQSSDDRLEFTALTYGQFNCMANYVAHKWCPLVKNVNCIGFLGNEPVQSLLAMLAVLKLRRTFFCISTRVPEPLIAKLLAETDTQLLVSSKKYQRVAHAVTKGLATTRVKISGSFDMDQLATLAIGCNDNDTYSETNGTEESLTDTVLLLHSSGSTGNPKPIYLSNSWIIMLIRCMTTQSNNMWGDLGIKSTSVILPTTPLFHTTGVLTYLMSIISGSHVILLRSFLTSPQDILSVMEKYNVDIIFTTPAILYDLADYIQDKGNNTVESFKQVKVCWYGGEQLVMRYGEFLHFKGLNVRSAYGLTEIGATAVSRITKDNKYWYTIKPLDEMLAYCHWEPFDNDLYHLMIRSDWPGMSLSAPININGYFETTDLFREYPPHSGYWLHVGRIADILVMSNGKKTYPTPLEREIRNSEFVNQCALIGERRTCTAVLIELSMHAAKYNDEQTISEVHEAIQAANKIAPDHSVIAVPEMVYILPPNRKLKLISKGTASRKDAIQDFKEEIEKLYSNSP